MEYIIYDIGDEWPLERVTEGRTVLPRFEGAETARVAGYVGVANGVDDIKRGFGEYKIELLDAEGNIVGMRGLPPHRMQANIEDNGKYTIIVPVKGGDNQ